MNLSDPGDALYDEGPTCALCGTPDCPDAQVATYAELKAMAGRGSSDEARYRHYPGGDYKPASQPAKYRQVDGAHYKDCLIQPYEYAIANGFNYLESLALRYLTRHAEKNGETDLRKLIHCIELLIEATYGPTRTVPDQNPEP